MIPSGAPSHRSLLGQPLVLVLLLAANVLPELVFLLAEAGLIPAPGLRFRAFAYGAFQPDVMAPPGPLFALQPGTMFLSYGFLHTGPTHLAVNMLGLLWLGRRLLAHRTGEAFVTFYILSLIGAAELFALLGPGLSPTVGASGALFGLLGVLAVDTGIFASAEPSAEEPGLQFFRLSLATVALALVDLASQALFGTATAWQAHSGGFLTGAVAALIFRPRFRGSL